ncbi:Cerato-platanin-domain-containing protein [Ephemerocybe angulata]|uniref:Cerato-platanin-domain-containing protein n=1 Tax=Ephemerocybe angulata TaxID=980116 RepID=A0A8H6I6F6_9AGAR|nr:Cerato-platanin-domain-containing protein [Tulosesus angulatus]
MSAVILLFGSIINVFVANEFARRFSRIAHGTWSLPMKSFGSVTEEALFRMITRRILEGTRHARVADPRISFEIKGALFLDKDSAPKTAKPTFTLTFIASIAAAAMGQTTSCSYDSTFDNAAQSLAVVACSDGANGLLTRGFTTFGSLPAFPRIGAAPAVTGWNSPACGTCWELAYQGRSINVIALDYGPNGFDISKTAMNQLTNGQAEQLGRVNVDYRQLDKSACGL